MSNSPRANYFQQGRLTLCKLCTGHPRTPGIDLIYQIYTVLRTHLLGRGLIWLGHFGSSTFGLFGLYPLSLSKSAGFVSLLSWESFIGFYIWCYLISTILACLFTVGVRISWKKLCRKGNMEGEFDQIITKIRLSIKTTTANRRVSFIDLYLVFPTNFRIVFLSLTNTAILLER